MSLTLFFFTVVIILTLIMATLGQILPSHQPDTNKTSPYECGFEPINSSRLPFSFRFFLVAILFLIFDLEIALLLPLPFSSLLSNLDLSISPLILFISILVIGLYYEWVNGGLDWAND
uniref:NADH-ubiquinone oxidoreductase chain 3 n=1 Tax=Ophionereis sp. TaxID=3135531 RepID=A0AAU6PX11_9ECHI